MAQLKQEITLLSGIGQLSTTLLGTGLFMVPAIAAGIAGNASLWAWFILLLAICPIALTFAALGKRYPNAGGTAHFVKQAFGLRAERAVAWLFVSVIPVGIPPAIALAAGFIQHILPSPLDIPIAAQMLTLLLLMAVNLTGSRSSGRIQSIIAIAIFTLVAAFFWYGNIGTADLTMPALNAVDMASIGSALGVMFWCFVGIEAFAHMGEEFKNPTRDFPVAIIIGCVIAGIIYWAASIVILKFGAYGSPAFDVGAIPWLSALLFGEQASWLISLIGFFACFASINLYTQSLARMIWAQARTYRPEHRMAKLSGRGVPAYATLLVGAILAISCIIGERTDLDLQAFLEMANGIFVLVYLLAMLAATRLLHGVARHLAILSTGLCLAVVICLGWAMSYAVVVFILLLLPWRKAKANRQIKSIR